MDHSVYGAVLLSVLPLDLRAEFYSDDCGMPRYRVPYGVVYFLFPFFLLFF